MNDPIPRLFTLRRDRDITGVSGPGDVADGVRWPDGTVVLRWRERPSTSVWDSLDLMLSVHGHDGATRVVWAEDEAQARHNLTADVLEAYDLPASILGAEAEWNYLNEQIRRVLRDAAEDAKQCWDRRELEVKGSLGVLAHAVMPVIAQVLKQRDRARAAAGRAYQLADRWEAAHGSAHCLVRVAGAELRDELDEDAGGGCENTSHGSHVGFTCAEVERITPYWNVRWGQEYARALYAAAECSAQHHGHDEGPRQCIRAAQHRGDHIDEHGFHWSDTVAVYPILDGEPKCGRAASSCSNPDHACKVCGDCMYQHPGEGGCPEAPGHPAHIELATERAIAADLRVENRALRAKAARAVGLEAALSKLADDLEAEEAYGGAWDSNHEAARRIREVLGQEKEAAR